MLGDMRNDLYLTLTRGDFEKGAKTAAKNIEVRVTMFDADGNVIQVGRTGCCLETLERDKPKEICKICRCTLI